MCFTKLLNPIHDWKNNENELIKKNIPTTTSNEEYLYSFDGVPTLNTTESGIKSTTKNIRQTKRSAPIVR